MTHVLELIEQDVEHLLALWPDAPIGINSAGIGQREWDAPIIFAGRAERLAQRRDGLVRGIWC